MLNNSFQAVRLPNASKKVCNYKVICQRNSFQRCIFRRSDPGPSSSMEASASRLADFKVPKIPSTRSNVVKVRTLVFPVRCKPRGIVKMGLGKLHLTLTDRHFQGTKSKRKKMKNSPITYIKMPASPYTFVPGKGYVSKPKTSSPFMPLLKMFGVGAAAASSR